MRRWPTWLVVGALVALGAFAAADALRGGGSVRRTEPTRTTAALIRPNEPEGSAMKGVLYYTDAGCVLRGFELANLREVQAPRWGRCHFAMSPAGPLLADPRAVWSPAGGIYAIDTPEGIELASPASAETITLDGRSPAFKPDGTFTYVRGSDLVEWSTDCPPGTGLFTLPGDNATARCRRVVLSPVDLRRAAISADGGPLVVKDIVWLDDTRVVVVLGDASVSGYREHVAVFAGRAATGVTFSEFGEGLRLERSPRGNFFTAWYAHNLVGIRDRQGELIQFPRLAHVQAVTWSPDERWTAVATPHSVYVFRTNEAQARLHRLDIQARDLAWR